MTTAAPTARPATAAIAWVQGIPARILSHCVIGENDCLEWVGATTFGYGSIKFAGRMHRVHRLVWTIIYGPFKETLQVCHKCDNRCCINPDHLFLGTQKDNIHDMINKGRDNMLRNKLSIEQVIYVRDKLSEGISRLALATELSVTKKTIANIDRGISWSDL